MKQHILMTHIQLNTFKMKNKKYYYVNDEELNDLKNKPLTTFLTISNEYGYFLSDYLNKFNLESIKYHYEKLSFKPSDERYNLVCIYDIHIFKNLTIYLYRSNVNAFGIHINIYTDDTLDIKRKS
jgi:hypothetical protein